MTTQRMHPDQVLTRFNQLITDVLGGGARRNTFSPWEVAILLDINDCSLASRDCREVLRRYQKAVQRRIENGATEPMLLSDYLSGLRLRNEARTAVAVEA